jgi:anti-sigma regulatory factor (Ser/Thr protein kinase)
MGLFQCCHFDIGSQPRKVLPLKPSTHIPITIINIDELKQEAIEKNKHVGDILEEYANKFAKLITDLDEGSLVDTLTYCFREITRNVVEHANAKNLVFCAQYWPYLGKAEIVVLDKGKGILESLNENASLPDLTNHKEALNFALLPSISSKVQYGRKSKSSDDFWQNTGFGLYMTHRIASLGGDFFISSGDHGLRWQTEEKTDYEVNHLSGTILRIVIKTDQIIELSNTLNQFREDGYKLAKTITKMKIEPSRASLMLSRNRPTT